MATLRLVGSGQEHLQHLLSLPGVEVTGRVPSMAPELERATAVVVPVRYGGGTRLKVLEALAHGVPVVSTPMGVEGLGVVDGEHALIAEDAEGLAKACVRLIADSELQRRLARAGRALYVANYRPEAADAAVARLLTDVLA